MNIGLDTTAGEKERGSLASVLVNQVSRTSISIGKIMYVIAAGLLNSVSSFAGIMAAIALAGSPFDSGAGANMEIFSAGRIAGLLFTLISLSSLAASIIILLGSYAKNVKEGASYVMPVYIVVIIIGVATMQMESAKQLYLFFIPVINTVFMLKEILLGQFSLLHMAVMLAVNLGCVAILARLVSRLFNSERILKSV